MTRFILIFLLLFTISNQLSAQYQRKNRDLIEPNFYKNHGWFISPGFTYTMPFEPKGETAPDVESDGRFALLYLEVGKWHLFPGGGNVFNYFDYSLAYKRLVGREVYNGNVGSFKQQFAVANFNINNVIQLSDFTFLQNSLGVNVDYKFADDIVFNGSPYNENTKNLLASLHYKFGFGYKATNSLFIIPSIETPILNVSEWEAGRSDYGIFSSRYRPFIFSVRFAWSLLRNKRDCPPIPGKNGQNKDKNYDDMLKME